MLFRNEINGKTWGKLLEGGVIGKMWGDKRK